MKLVFTTIAFGVLIVYVVFYGTSYALQPEGLMVYKIWSGMLIFNIVVVSINIRVLIMSDQISLALLISCLSGIVSYYVMFVLVEVILYSDLKATLSNQMSNSQYWLLLIFVCLVVEGYEWVFRKYQSAN